MSDDAQHYITRDFSPHESGRLIYSGPIYHIVYRVETDFAAEICQWWNRGFIARLDNDVDNQPLSVYGEIPEAMRRRIAEKGAAIDLVKERGEPVYFPSA